MRKINISIRTEVSITHIAHRTTKIFVGDGRGDKQNYTQTHNKLVVKNKTKKKNMN